MLEHINKLKSAINHYNYHYYTLGKPLITDQEFDALFNELERIESEHPRLLTKDSPTQKVGSDLSNDFQELPHLVPMLSLDKVYALEHLEQWVNKNAFEKELLSIEPKIDGCSVSITYEKGQFVLALSRGNGIKGNDITENVRTIKTLPSRIPSEYTYILRGEIFLLKSDFEAIKKNGDLEYANPRNFAAGVIRRVQSSKVNKVPLKILIYDAVCIEKPFHSHEEMLNFLIEQHFPTSALSCFVAKDKPSSFTKLNPKFLYATKPLPVYGLSELSFITDSFNFNRSAIPFEIDGLVFKLNSYQLREEQGQTTHHPKWAMALKFESPKAISKVNEIIVQIGRTGKVTPLALITPTLVNGSTISKVTLHNQSYINALELGLGDMVEIAKRGDVIPSIEKVLEKFSENIYTIPTTCPSCNQNLEEKGAHLFCTNFECEDKVKGRLLYFTKTLDMVGFGPAIINLLYDQFHIRTFHSLLQFNFYQLLDLEGFKDNKVNHFINIVAQTKATASLKKIMIALGVPEINEKVVSILFSKGYHTISALQTLSQEIAKDDTISFASWHQIGEKGEMVIKNVLSPSSIYLQELLALEQIGFSLINEVVKKEEQKILSSQFAETTWLITGVLQHFHPRKKAVNLIKQHGGNVVEAFSGKVSHLLIGANAGSKLKKAQEKGITIVDEESFLNMINK